jgi:hypothetical protein
MILKLNEIRISSFGGYRKMDIKKMLENQLEDINHLIYMAENYEQRVMLECAKVNILLGLQKYED